MNTIISINYLAILVCAITQMGLGMLWYSPVLFGKQWSKLMGYNLKSKDDVKKMQKEAGPAYVMSLIAAFVIAFVLSHFVDYTGSTTAIAGMITGFWCWLGFSTTTMLMNHMFSNKPVKLYLIDTGYQLVNMMIMGAVLAAWV
ncbi:DUF1761 domain-containing protein [Candidatus Peregrinibacteria bacterium]|nr:DUF1761 domain-containing protein [Candidatus Peregrinibacteria bacterium]